MTTRDKAFFDTLQSTLDRIVRETELFERRSMTTTELRQFNEVFDQLNAHPYTAVRVERYGETGAYLISPKLMDLLEQAAQGAARVFRLPVDLPTQGGELAHKLVVATELPLTDAPFQRWDVLVDSMHYALQAYGETDDATRARPDARQLIWRHHPDVARAVIEAFPWTEEHSHALGRAQQAVFGDTTGARLFVESALETLRIDEESLRIDDPRDEHMRMASQEFSTLDRLVDWLEQIGEEEFDAHCMRDAGPGGGMPLGHANEDFREIALALLAATHYDDLARAGFDVEDLDPWR